MPPAAPTAASGDSHGIDCAATAPATASSTNALATQTVPAPSSERQASTLHGCPTALAGRARARKRRTSLALGRGLLFGVVVLDRLDLGDEPPSVGPLLLEGGATAAAL